MKSITYTLYKITFPNTKSYIGITSRDFELRKKEHKWHWKESTQVIHKALDKYKDLETWEIVYQTKNEQDIYEKEIYFIELFQSFINDNGYNLTRGGEGITDYQCTEEQKAHNSMMKTQYLIKNPDILQKQIDALQKYRDENPSANRDNAIKQFATTEYRTWFGENLKKKYAENGFNGGRKKVPIKLIHKDTKEEFIFASVGEASKYLNISRNAISNVLCGVSKSMKHYDVIKLTQEKAGY